MAEGMGRGAWGKGHVAGWKAEGGGPLRLIFD